MVVCVNLLDEAKKKQIKIDLDELSLQLGVPVVGTSARSGKGLDALCEAVKQVVYKEKKYFISLFITMKIRSMRCQLWSRR